MKSNTKFMSLEDFLNHKDPNDIHPFRGVHKDLDSSDLGIELLNRYYDAGFSWKCWGVNGPPVGEAVHVYGHGLYKVIEVCDKAKWPHIKLLPYHDDDPARTIVIDYRIWWAKMKKHLAKR